MGPLNPSLCLAVAMMLVLAGAGVRAGDVASGRAKAAGCVPCHGADGVSKFPEVPHLAAQSGEYLIGQLKAFRHAGLGRVRPEGRGSRYDAVMDNHAIGLTDADIDNLAAFFSSRACAAPGATKIAAMPTLANRCASCHGVAGRSRTPTVPHLAAQRSQYLENQLRAFRDAAERTGTGDKRRRRSHPMMNRQADRLDDEDISGLASYFAAQRCE